MKTEVLQLISNQNKKKDYYKTPAACPFCAKDFWENQTREVFKKSECGEVLWVDNAFQVVPNVKLTLIIEHSSCSKQLGNYGVDHCRNYFNLLEFAYTELKETYPCVIVYKNVGKLSSGSVPHAHTQVSASHEVPFELPESSFEGLSVLNTPSVTVNVANRPIAEEFEINISNHLADWSDDFFVCLEGAIQYLQATYGEGASYNLLVDVPNKRSKVVCRTRPLSIMAYYGVRLLPAQDALEGFVEGLQKHLNK